MTGSLESLIAQRGNKYVGSNNDDDFQERDGITSKAQLLRSFELQTFVSPVCVSHTFHISNSVSKEYLVPQHCWINGKDVKGKLGTQHCCCHLICKVNLQRICVPGKRQLPKDEDFSWQIILTKKFCQCNVCIFIFLRAKVLSPGMFLYFCF